MVVYNRWWKCSEWKVVMEFDRLQELIFLFVYLFVRFLYRWRARRMHDLERMVVVLTGRRRSSLT